MIGDGWVAGHVEVHQPREVGTDSLDHGVDNDASPWNMEAAMVTNVAKC